MLLAVALVAMMLTFSGDEGTEFAFSDRIQVVEVAGELVGEVLLLTLLWDDAGDSQKPCSNAIHDGSSVVERKRARMAVVCSQLRASLSSCLRPARVSL